MITSTQTIPTGDFEDIDISNNIDWNTTANSGSITTTSGGIVTTSGSVVYSTPSFGTGGTYVTTPSITYSTGYSTYSITPCIITKEMFELRNIGNFEVAVHSEIFIDKRIKSKILAEKAIFKQIQDSLKEGGKIYWIEDHDDKQQTAASRIGSINS